MEKSDLESLQALARACLCAPGRPLLDFSVPRAVPLLSCHSRSKCDYLCKFSHLKAVSNAAVSNTVLRLRARQSYERTVTRCSRGTRWDLVTTRLNPCVHGFCCRCHHNFQWCLRRRGLKSMFLFFVVFVLGCRSTKFCFRVPITCWVVQFMKIFSGMDRVSHKLFSKKHVFWNTDYKIYFNIWAFYQKLIFRSFKYINPKLQLLSANCFSIMIKKNPASAVLQWLYKNLAFIVLQFKTSTFLNYFSD